MLPAVITQDEIDVERRLQDQFGTARADWIAVAQAAVGARNDATAFDPANAGGLFAYIYGTRSVRDLLVPKGYDVCRQDNVEATYSAHRGLKVIYQTGDSAADALHSPRAISAKGPASSRIIEASQPSLFPEWEEEQRRELNAQLAQEKAETWYFIVSMEGGDVRAELSRPYPLADGQFSGFSERIFILKPGDWSDLMSVDVGGGDVLQDFEINVTRK